MREKTERNKFIVRLVKEGWSYGKIRDEMGFRSRGTVAKIYWRDKDKFNFPEFSTG